MDNPRDPARLKDLLQELGPRLGIRKPASVGALWARWAEIVGDDIAANAEPTSIREGVLRIRTPSQAWATEIGYLGQHITERVNAAMGSELVREVKVWTGPGAIRVPSARTEEDAATTPAPRPRRTPDEAAEPRAPQEALEAARRAWLVSSKGRAPGRAQGPREGRNRASENPEKSR